MVTHSATRADPKPKGINLEKIKEKFKKLLKMWKNHEKIMRKLEKNEKYEKKK